MNATFNLVDRPWLDALDGNGRPRRISLLDAFTDPSLSRLAMRTRTAEPPAYLLLVSIAMDAMRPDRDDPPLELDIDVITSYLGRMHDRFDLFHPEHPFGQAAWLGTIDKAAKVPYQLIREFHTAPEKEQYLGHYTPQTMTGLPSADAAQHLLHHIATFPGGTTSTGDPSERNGRSAKAAPMRGKIIHIPHGRTLRETILLSMPDAAILGRPAWHAEGPDGMLGLLTATVAAVFLRSEDGGATVSHASIGNAYSRERDGERYPGGKGYPESPFLGYDEDNEGGPVYAPDGNDGAFDLWRKIPKLAKARVPIAASARERSAHLGLPRPAVRLYAMNGVGKTSATSVSEDQIPLVPPELRLAAAEQLTTLDTAITKIGEHLAIRTGAHRHSDTTKPQKNHSAQHRFIRQMEPIMRAVLMDAISDPDQGVLSTDRAKAVRTAAIDIYVTATPGWDPMRAAEGQRRILQIITRFLPMLSTKTTTEKETR
ncbi:type I-E CRISPR-associated protein Cse1/CasA [Brachybacterium hainanense]|uniref:Type I-E CRISPR-associated protein Cse1/CasA n=1 Tax=Brachybacterium hainanense TaxID=1541174 RepID=A0ABV6R8Z7_9MICO